MAYHQITSEERYTLSALRRQGFNQSEIARAMRRHRSSISRELRRNSSSWDGGYRRFVASHRTRARRSRSRRNQRFAREDFRVVEFLLRKRRGMSRRLRILMRRAPNQFKMITSDNGTEFHDYASVEEAMGVRFYFATPYHSWERGSNENFNGLLRQYIPPTPRSCRGYRASQPRRAGTFR